MSNQEHKYTIGIDALKENDLPLQIDTLIKPFNLSSVDRINIKTVLIELVTNSLEHGLLELDSALKKDAQGFAKYYTDRQSHLDALTQGVITIGISRQKDGGAEHLIITVEDTGSGFEHAKYTATREHSNSLAGRGIMLVQNLCESLDYALDGRKVTLKYRLEEPPPPQVAFDSVTPADIIARRNSLYSILLVEDEAATLKFMAQFLKKLGYQVITADHVDAGIACFDRHQPDIVLTDYNMPGRLGIDLIHYIRSQNSDYWTPIVVLSAMHEEQKVLKCLEAGADDYLTKPVNLKILNAKIETHSRLVSMQRENISTKSALEKAYYEMAQEEILAESLLDKILLRNPTDNLPLCYWLQPATRFSGDLICIDISKDNELFIIIADVTGHGLPASFTTLIIAQIFHDMVERHCSLEDIAIKLNSATYHLLPANFFAAANIIKLNASRDSVAIWSGGLPDILITDIRGQLIDKVSSQHMALGIMHPDRFNATTQTFAWQQNVRLCAYTDGIIESRNPQGEKFEENRLLTAINGIIEPQTAINSLQDALKTYVGENAFEDDVSMLLLDIESVSHVAED